MIICTLNNNENIVLKKEQDIIHSY